MSYVIHPIPLVATHVPKSFLAYLTGFYDVIRIGHYVWFIEGTREKILVDAGFTYERASARTNLIKNPEHIQSIEDGLKKLGLEPGDISTLIVTHADHDHISSLHKFFNARKVIQRTELDFVLNPHPVFKTWRPPDYAKLIDGMEFEQVEGDTKLDEGIELLFTPGHTPGGQSVAIKTAKGTAVITGWCCIKDSFFPAVEMVERGLRSIPPGVHTNLMQSYESIEKIKDIADIIIPVHEADFIKQTTI